MAEPVPSDYREIKGKFRSEPSPHGTIRYLGEHNGPILEVSPLGDWILERFPKLVDLVNVSGLHGLLPPRRHHGYAGRGYVTQERAGNLALALKHIKQEVGQLTGFHQHEALMVLDEVGLPVPRPLFATPTKLVRTKKGFFNGSLGRNFMSLTQF